jgi:hypothetical protein
MEMANDEGALTSAPDNRPKARLRILKKPEKRSLVQSSVGFPYNDLDTGIAVAQAIMGAGGVALTREQLAGVMKLSVSSGTFITKTATARIFGLIATVQGKYELTNLGFAIIDNDENSQRAAKAEAFLTVPLYKRTYEEFKGRQLPPRAYNARLAFDKSANQAGFFPAGPDRLIEPILRGPVGPTGPTGPAGPISYGNSPPSPNGPSGPPAGGLHERMSADLPVRPRFYSAGGGDVGLDLDQLIVGLLKRLPKSGEEWETEKRARWLQTLSANFDMIYQADDGKIIVVECKTKSE